MLVLVAAGSSVAASALLADKAGCSCQHTDCWLCGCRTARRAPRTSESYSVPNSITSPSEGSTTPGRHTVEVSAGTGLSIPWLRRNWLRAVHGFAVPHSLQGQVSWSGGQLVTTSASPVPAGCPLRVPGACCLPLARLQIDVNPSRRLARDHPAVPPRAGSLTPVLLPFNFIALPETILAASELLVSFLKSVSLTAEGPKRKTRKGSC